MKAMKLVMMAVVAALMGTTLLTSCLDSGDGNYSDGSGWFEVDPGTYGGVTLKHDGSDLTLTPQNPTLIQYQDGSYAKHVLIDFSFPEGDPGFTEGVNKYDVIIDRVIGETLVKDLCRTDTLTHTGAGIFQFVESGYTWASHSFLTLEFEAPLLSSTNVKHFDLYVDDATEEALYLNFVQNQEIKSGIYNKYNGIVSFKLPRIGDIQYKFPDLKFFGSTNDSVYIVVTADSYQEENKKIETNKFKVKLRNY